MKDESIKWLDERERPELVGMWFKNRAVQVAGFMARALELAYGGLDGDTTPEAVLQDVKRLRRQATFVSLLAAQTYADRKATWPSEEASQDARMLHIEAQRALDAMAGDVKDIEQLAAQLAQLAQLIEKTDSQAGAPAGV